jgi:hypothetical protein
MTHNQILWVWMRVGCIGFFCFWIMMMSFIIQGTQLARDQCVDEQTRSLAVFAVLMTIMLLVFGLLDLQISNIRDMLFCGIWIGTIAGLRAKSLAAERSRVPEPAYLKLDSSRLTTGRASAGPELRPEALAHGGPSS